MSEEPDSGIVRNTAVQNIQIAQAVAAVENAATAADWDRAQAELEMILMQRTDANG